MMISHRSRIEGGAGEIKGQKLHKEMVGKPTISSNPFHVLEEEGEDKSKEEGGPTNTQETEMKGSKDEKNTSNRLVIMEEDEAEDMDLGDIDLDTVEAECRKASLGYVPLEQIELLQQAIIQSKAHKDLGISVEGQKGSKRKTPKED